MKRSTHQKRIFHEPRIKNLVDLFMLKLSSFFFLSAGLTDFCCPATNEYLQPSVSRWMLMLLQTQHRVSLPLPFISLLPAVANIGFLEFFLPLFAFRLLSSRSFIATHADTNPAHATASRFQ